MTIWERVANTFGKVGRNIPLDLNIPREYNAYWEYVDNNSKIRNPRKLGRHLKLSQKRDFDNHLADLPRQPDLNDDDYDENDDDNSDDGFDIHDNVILNIFSWILCMLIRRKCLYYI